MTKDLVLASIPEISYPYKLIYSFFDNFCNTKEYNSIKEAVLGYGDVKNRYVPYSYLYNVFFLFKYNDDFGDLSEAFNLIFKKKIGEDVVMKIKAIMKEENTITRHARYYKLCLECDLETSFFVYLMFIKDVNNSYKKLIVLPHELRKNVESIKDEHILSIYLKCVFDQEKQLEERNLFENVKRIFLDHGKQINSRFIKHIYIFGSVVKNTYHRESDIDLVLEFHLSTNYEDKKAYVKDLSNLIKKTLNRKIDIQEYADFILYNKHIELFKLL